MPSPNKAYSAPRNEHAAEQATISHSNVLCDRIKDVEIAYHTCSSAAIATAQQALAGTIEVEKTVMTYKRETKDLNTALKSFLKLAIHEEVKVDAEKATKGTLEEGRVDGGEHEVRKLDEGKFEEVKLEKTAEKTAEKTYAEVAAQKTKAE